MSKVLISPLLACVLAAATAAAAAAQPSRPASLAVTVKDVTGLVIVGASVAVSQEELATPVAAVTGGRGVARLEGLTAGSGTLRASSPGFEELVLDDLTLKSGANQLTVTLHIAGLAEDITVGQDPRAAAVDPRGDTMTVTITEEEMDTLPDTAEELQAVLLEMAGPDAEITVDGFLGGELPPKERIMEIRIQRAMYSADRQWGGRSRIQIITRPGTENWRGSVGFGFRDDALNATTAFAPTETSEQLRRLGVTIEGPIVNGRTSLAIEVEGLSAFDSQIVRAGTPANPVSGLLRQPEEELEVTIGVQHALSQSQMLRVEYRQDDNDGENLGVGTYDLAERAYSRIDGRKRARISSLGTFAGRFLNETRIQLEWDDSDTAAAGREPTVRVLDWVTFGGANIRGGRREQEFSLDQKTEFQAGVHNFSTGGRFEWSRYRSDEIRNPDGTFTFSTPEALAAGIPDTYSVRRGDPSVAYSFFTGGIFLQDDIRIRDSFSLGIGLRQDWQSHLDDRLNLSPRLGFSWALTDDGRTTMRGGLGIFNQWYDASTYEETLQLDGTRVEEITIQNPGYPDPFAGGDLQVVLPNGLVRQSPDLIMPTSRQGTLAIERRLTDAIRLDIGYSFRDGRNQLRGRNLNAPGLDGVRPDPSVGNVIEIRSIGKSVQDRISVGGNVRLPWQNLFLAGRYSWEKERDDGNGPMALPADNQNPDEWGPASGDVRHRVFAFAAIEPLPNLRLGLNVRAQSATPYTITTGFDDNEDTVFNDRPAGIGRNSVRGDGFFGMDARLSWRLGFGNGRGVSAQRGGREGRRGRGDWREQHQMMSELYVRASNVLNTVAYSNFSGVQTSPLFGQPTSARPARRIEVGTRMMF